MVLQELPACLGSLKRLKVLAADQNRITSVSPALLSGCTALATLTLHENPITIEARIAPLCALTCPTLGQGGGCRVLVRVHRMAPQARNQACMGARRPFMSSQGWHVRCWA